MASLFILHKDIREMCWQRSRIVEQTFDLREKEKRDDSDRKGKIGLAKPP